MSRLHERWLKDCVFYRELYKQVNEVGLQPRINWAQVFNQKQVSRKYIRFHFPSDLLIWSPYDALQVDINSNAYGPSMGELEKQIAAHNILHKEIEAYNGQLSPDSTSSKVRIWIHQGEALLQQDYSLSVIHLLS